MQNYLITTDFVSHLYFNLGNLTLGSLKSQSFSIKQLII